MYSQTTHSQRLPKVLGLLFTITLLLAACTQPAPAGTPVPAPPAIPLASSTQPVPVAPALTPTLVGGSPTAVRTPSPAAALPASTAVTAQCTVVPVMALGKVYAENPNVARALGCAAEPERALALAEQPFQNGFMYWRSDSRQIYAIMQSGRWAVFPDTWNEGDPSPSLGTPVPASPPGLAEPVRGFGKVWRERPEVRSGLGWATAREQGYQGFVQPFANGAMLWSERKVVWVLFTDGTWLRFADTT